MLRGSEVKSLRGGKVNLQEAYCDIQGGEMLLVGCHISPYTEATHFNHDPVRPRKLLLHKREIKKLTKATEQKGYTIVPLAIYLKNRMVKVKIGLAKGKKLYDKRDTLAERDTKRELERVRKGGQADE